MRFTAQIVSFFNLLAFALTCAGCHSPGSSAVLGVPPAEAAWLFQGLQSVWVLRGGAEPQAAM